MVQNENDKDLTTMNYDELKCIAEGSRTKESDKRIAYSYYLMAGLKSAYRKDNLNQAKSYGYLLTEKELEEINSTKTSKDPSYGQNALRNIL